MPQDKYPGQEKRQYIRLDTVFPVGFRLEDAQAGNFLSPWLQGFTNNIGKGGLCLAVNNFEPELAQILKGQQVALSLEIELPIIRKPVKARAKVVWIRYVLNAPNRYLIGLNYEQIDLRQSAIIMRYARFKKIFLPASLGAIIILGIAFLLNSLLTVKLIQGNKALVNQLVQILQESSVAKQKVKELNKEKEDLQIKLQTLEVRILIAADELSKAKTAEILSAEKITQLDSLIARLNQEKSALQGQIIAVQRNENNITEDLLRLDKRKANLEKANSEKMYLWLKAHQNPRTGLVMSFEGDADLADWAFIYDQSLVLQAFTNFSDFERAKKTLDFFLQKAQRAQGLFLNAYYFNDGQPAEYVVHSGPNIWLGIAILHYTRASADKTYLALAEEIAARIIDIQNRDPEGGLRGGPQLDWFSTEHNLDAYAFFKMLHKVTNKPGYVDASNKILSWLIQHAYDRSGLPINRGRGDSTIATDTYAWSIAAIGPRQLRDLGLNPDEILEFAEQNCSVETTFLRPGNEAAKIKGFDFAPRSHLARGGIISSEWTAQMVIAFKIMSEFYYKEGLIAKARSYAAKADEYLASLGNMIISSPSASGQGQGCLPYATQDATDTGHGWHTPKGKDTGSVAGTAYTLFAYYSYNPLELKD